MLDVIRRKSQSFVVKIIFGIIILVFVFWGASSVNTSSPQTMALVNDTEISAMDFSQEYKRQAEILRSLQGSASFGDQQREELGQYVLQQMISRELLRQEAVRLGLGTSDTELSYAVAKSPQFFGADGKFSEERYKAALLAANMTPGLYERNISNEIMEYKLRNYIGSSVSLSPEEARRSFRFDYQRRIVEYALFPSSDYLSLANPGEKEIADYYEANKESFAIPPMADFEYLLFTADSLADSVAFSEQELQEYYAGHQDAFQEPALYRVRHIMFAVPAGAAADSPSVREALAKAEEARKEIASGKTFASAALEYSDDSHSRSDGGDLGWLEPGQIEKPLEDALLSLKPGEISGPVRTSYGIHLVQLDEAKAARKKQFAEVKDEIIRLKKEDAILRRMEEIQQEVEDSIITGKDLNVLEQQYNLTIRRTGLKDIGALADELGIKAALLTDLVSVQPGTVLPMPVEHKDGFMALKLVSYVPGSIPPVDSVRPEILNSLRAVAASSLAVEDAGRAAGEIKSSGANLPATVRERLKESAAFGRSGGFMEQGLSVAAAQAAFTAKPGQWLEEPFPVPGGAVLVKVKEVLEPSDSEWEEKASMYTEQLLDNRRNILFNAYFGLLVKNSEIDILVDKIFQN